MNNTVKNCPPLMSDKRYATDYRPSCQVHDLIVKQNNIRNSEQMRLFLQRNADKIHDMSVDHFFRRGACTPCEYYHVDPNGHDRVKQTRR